MASDNNSSEEDASMFRKHVVIELKDTHSDGTTIENVYSDPSIISNDIGCEMVIVNPNLNRDDCMTIVEEQASELELQQSYIANIENIHQHIAVHFLELEALFENYTRMLYEHKRLKQSTHTLQQTSFQDDKTSVQNDNIMDKQQDATNSIEILYRCNAGVQTSIVSLPPSQPQRRNNIYKFHEPKRSRVHRARAANRRTTAAQRTWGRRFLSSLCRFC